MENETQPQKKSVNLFQWKLKPEELKYQVENYRTLKFYQSVRGIVATLFTISIIATVALSYFMETEISYLAIVVYIVLGILIYFGKSWASIIAIILISLDKLVQIIFAPGFAIVGIIWWLMYMGVLLQTYQVERERKRDHMVVSDVKKIV